MVNVARSLAKPPFDEPSASQSARSRPVVGSEYLMSHQSDLGFLAQLHEECKIAVAIGSYFTAYYLLN